MGKFQTFRLPSYLGGFNTDELVDVVNGYINEHRDRKESLSSELVAFRLPRWFVQNNYDVLYDLYLKDIKESDNDAIMLADIIMLVEQVTTLLTTRIKNVGEEEITEIVPHNFIDIIVTRFTDAGHHLNRVIELYNDKELNRLIVNETAKRLLAELKATNEAKGDK